MSLVLLATASDPAANAYTTKAFADDYFAGRTHAAPWAVLTSSAPDLTMKDMALVSATRRLDQERWAGIKYSAAQALKWPRYGVFDEDGRLVDQSTVPVFLQQATCELALFLLANPDADPLTYTGLEGFREIGLPGIKITPENTYGQKPGALPPQVARLLRGYRTSSGGAVKLVRVDDDMGGSLGGTRLW